MNKTNELYPNGLTGEPPPRQVEVFIMARNIRGCPSETQTIAFTNVKDLDNKIEAWATDTEWGKVDCEITDEHSVLTANEIKFLEDAGCTIMQG